MSQHKLPYATQRVEISLEGKNEAGRKTLSISECPARCPGPEFVSLQQQEEQRVSSCWGGGSHTKLGRAAAEQGSPGRAGLPKSPAGC